MVYIKMDVNKNVLWADKKNTFVCMHKLREKLHKTGIVHSNGV